MTVLASRVQPGSIDQIKKRMKDTWEDGDYASFATFMTDGAIEILKDWNIPSGSQLLDVGCGSGQSAIPAARMGCKVHGVDIAENLIDHAKIIARAEGLNANFQVADAEDLPFEDQRFDALITMIGAMFAPNPDNVVKEMARVTRPGGKIYMANWTPQSMPAQMFRCVAAIIPPPENFIPPTLWGDEETVMQRLSGDFTDIQLQRKYYPQWIYPFDASGIVHLFQKQFGPVKRAYDACDLTAKLNFTVELQKIFAENSIQLNDTHTKIVGGEYLEVIATRR